MKKLAEKSDQSGEKKHNGVKLISVAIIHQVFTNRKKNRRKGCISTSSVKKPTVSDAIGV
jgi:hypothetical protein